jgi:hypothetical protein
VSKTARQGGVEIVRTISAEEWVEMLNESLLAVAEAAVLIQEGAEEISMSLTEMAAAIKKIRERWSEINFTG